MYFDRRSTISRGDELSVTELSSDDGLSMRNLTSALLRLPGVGRRLDQCRGWLTYVGTFGDDFFSDDECFDDDDVIADALV